MIMLHLWSLKKILQNSAHAALVEGVAFPHRVVGNSFVHRVPVDNSLYGSCKIFCRLVSFGYFSIIVPCCEF